MSKAWEHEALQHDLALTRRAVGEIAVERLAIGSYGGGGQMDVFAVRPSWTQPTPTVYEVKISRPDFLRDTQAGKYERYLPYCRRLYFATPAGMIDRKEVPVGMGLCVRGETGWRTVVAPRVRPEPDGWPEILFSLLLKIHPGPWDRPNYTREQRVEATAKAIETRRAGLATAPKVAAVLDELGSLRDSMVSARHQLCDVLGVDPEVDTRDLWHLAWGVKNLAPAKIPDEVKKLGWTLRAAREQIEHAEGIVNDLVAAPTTESQGATPTEERDDG